MYEMGVPGWLLNIIMGFLKDRSMVLTFDGGESDPKMMPGGGPAGTTLGLLMFVILINNTADPGNKISWGEMLTSPLNSRQPILMTHGKQIDDVTIGESVNMEKVLQKTDENFWTRPLTRRERFELTLPEEKNQTNFELKKVASYADKNFMKINLKKSQAILFNPKKRKIDFLPTIKLRGENLEVVESMRLVGLVINEDLTWKDNTNSITKRAYKKLWMLRRLKNMGAQKSTLRIVYFRHIRSILEFAVPVWNGAITQKEVKKLERVQKVALNIIYGSEQSYKKKCIMFKIENLVHRRKKLCLKFAKKALMHDKFKNWFKEKDTVASKTSYFETISRQKKLQKSPISYLTRLLNKNNH